MNERDKLLKYIRHDACAFEDYALLNALSQTPQDDRKCRCRWCVNYRKQMKDSDEGRAERSGATAGEVDSH